LDIIDQCNRIEDHIRHYGGGEETFRENWRFQDNVVLNLERLGEAVNRLSVGLTLRHPEVNWSGVVGTRIVIAHHYWKLDMDSIWLTATQDVPDLKAKFERILDELEEPQNRENQLSG
jgi:uncharacterized protein with HEPN domain